jgi:hypothetical protein
MVMPWLQSRMNLHYSFTLLPWLQSRINLQQPLYYGYALPPGYDSCDNDFFDFFFFFFVLLLINISCDNVSLMIYLFFCLVIY